MDLFAYQNYMDRDGKFQLQMLSHSGFTPLSRSMGPMLKEESFHLGTGFTGLKRVAKANLAGRLCFDFGLTCAAMRTTSR